MVWPTDRLFQKTIALRWANLKNGFPNRRSVRASWVFDLQNTQPVLRFEFWFPLLCHSGRSSAVTPAFIRHLYLALVLLRTRTEYIPLNFHCTWCWHVLDGCQTYSDSSLPLTRGLLSLSLPKDQTHPFGLLTTFQFPPIAEGHPRQVLVEACVM